MFSGFRPVEDHVAVLEEIPFVGAFNLLMPLPPSLVSITPGENSIDPVVVAEITGFTFRLGVTVRLTRAEFQDKIGRASCRERVYVLV